MKIKKFTFNPFSENTYIIYDNGSAAIFDPGMSNSREENKIDQFINDNELNLSSLINTHCHIDHILGNDYISKKYGLKLQSSEAEKLTMSFAPQSAQMWNIPFVGSPSIEVFLKEGDTLNIGNSSWRIFEVPGHSVGHLIFVNDSYKTVIGGDTLFHGSIGRTDLPGGDHEQLLKNIREKMFTLPEDFRVYSGHGPETTIGFEKSNNPWF